MTEYSGENRSHKLDFLKGHGPWGAILISTLKYLARHGSYRNRVLAALIIIMNEAEKWLFPAPRGRICRETRLNGRTVDRILDEMKAEGVIYFEKQGRGKQRIFCFVTNCLDVPILTHLEDATNKAQPQTLKDAPNIQQQDATHSPQQKKEVEIKDKKEDSLSVFQIFSQEFLKIKRCEPAATDMSYRAEVESRYRQQLAIHPEFANPEILRHFFRFHFRKNEVCDLKTMLHATWIGVYLGAEDGFFSSKRKIERYQNKRPEETPKYCTHEENLAHIAKILQKLRGNSPL